MILLLTKDFIFGQKLGVSDIARRVTFPVGNPPLP